MNIEDKIHLEFIHNRLIDVYGENRNTDFVKKLLAIINDEPKGQTLHEDVGIIKKASPCNCGEAYQVYNDMEGTNVCTLCGNDEVA